MMGNTLDIPMPDYASRAIRELEACGFEAWIVGGCVRDALLGRDVHDYDIATAAGWRDVERILGNAGFAVHRTGTKHGTVTASLGGHALEITTFRADGAYSDGRHPDSVEFVRTIEEDLARRDFTINAMAYHPKRGLLDCWGGRGDLETKTLRAVGDPLRRFREDGLRILRGCRFASQLGFSLEADTYFAMTKAKRGLLGISSERITHEMDALLLGEHVHDALMETVDIISAVIPEIAACKGFEQHTPYHIYDVWEHTAWVVQRAPETRLARWAALFHDIGKPAAFYMENGRGHFKGHPEISARLAEGAMKRLLMSPSFSAQVLTLVRYHDWQIAATPRSVRRALARLGGDVDLFRTLCGIKRADALGQSELNRERLELSYELVRVLDEVLASEAAFKLDQLAIDGRDLIALGIPAGPEIGDLLDAALDAVMDERVPNERAALIRFVETTRTR